MPSTLRLEVKEKQTRNQCCKRTHAPKDKVWAVRPIRTSDKIRSKCQVSRHWNETWKDRKGKSSLLDPLSICIHLCSSVSNIPGCSWACHLRGLPWTSNESFGHTSSLLCLILHSFLHVFCMSSACLVLCHTGLSPSIEPSVHGVGPSLRVKLSHEHLGLSLDMRNLHRLSKVHSNSSQRQKIFCSIRLKEQKAWRNLKNSVLSFDIR